MYENPAIVLNNSLHRFILVFLEYISKICILFPKEKTQKTVSVNEMRNQPAQLYNSFLHKLNSQYTSTPKYISINL